MNTSVGAATTDGVVTSVGGVTHTSTGADDAAITSTNIAIPAAVLTISGRRSMAPDISQAGREGDGEPGRACDLVPCRVGPCTPTVTVEVMTMTDTKVPRIVVGIDGSATSLGALRFAIGEARRRGGTVDAVHGWTVPYYGDFTGVMPYPGEQMASAAEQLMTDALANIEGEKGDVVVTGRVVEGAPAFAITEASKGADLVVVGRRGHGGFIGLLLGSVAQQVAYHADCPVVLVPAEQ